MRRASSLLDGCFSPKSVGCRLDMPPSAWRIASPSPAPASLTLTPPPPLPIAPAARAHVAPTPLLGDLEAYVPLPTFHPAFGQQQQQQQQQAAALANRRKRKPLLSTVHPAFGTRAENPLPCELFNGPVGVSGFFLAIDPNVCFLRARKERLNPNAQLTISDSKGSYSRARYRCCLTSSGGVKVEALLRFQVGWISPKVTFAQLPEVIILGKGFDVSVPFLLHFTMVSILDERGCATGSFLYFSGTPMLGLSIGYSVINAGKLTLNNKRPLNPPRETQRHFYGFGRAHKFHYRQAGFVAFKVGAWLVCGLVAIPAFEPLQRVKCECVSTLPEWVRPYVSWIVQLH